MYTYYKIIGKIDGEEETLYGSYRKSDCTYELEAERVSWHGEGYKSIKIVPEQTTEAPDPEVYGDVINDKFSFTEDGEVI